MAGSALVPIIVPIGMVIALALWLALIFYADAHPVGRRADAAREPGPPSAAGPRPAAGGASGQPEAGAPAIGLAPPGGHAEAEPAPHEPARRAA